MASLPLLKPSVNPFTKSLKMPYLTASSSVQFPNSFKSTPVRVHCARAPRTTERLSFHHSSHILEKPYLSASSPTVRFPNSLRSTTVRLPHRRTPPSKIVCKSHETVPATERLISAVVYLLPFFTGLNYGRHLFTKYPVLELAFEPIVPLLSFYRSIPCAGLVSFLAILIGVVRDPKFSRYVRFNSVQALMLDALLILPSMVLIIFNSDSGLGFRLVEMGFNSIFVIIVAGFLYTLGFCLIGRSPYFPLVTDSAEWHLNAIDRQF